MGRDDSARSPEVAWGCCGHKTPFRRAPIGACLVLLRSAKVAEEKKKGRCSDTGQYSKLLGPISVPKTMLANSGYVENAMSGRGSITANTESQAPPGYNGRYAIRKFSDPLKSPMCANQVQVRRRTDNRQLLLRRARHD